MIANAPAPGAPPPIPFSARVIVDAWRGITLKTIGVTFLIGTVYFLYYLIRVSPPDYGWWLLRAFLWKQVDVFAIVLCVLVADRLTGRNPQRRAPYAWAVVIGAFAAEFVMIMVLGNPLSGQRPRPQFALYFFIELAFLGLAAVFTYFDRQRARAALARLHSAELDRIRTSKQVLESQLQAMQARVEPQFLFNTLAHVRNLYERNPARADRMLNELIAYLRAAMPSMRDTVSTVSREIDLVRAYLAIVSLRTDDRLDVRIEVPAEALDATLPPMMLLPLVDRGVLHGVAPWQYDRLGIRASVAGARLRIAIADSGESTGAGAGVSEVKEIRERLAALHGDRASLTLRPAEGGGTEAVLEIPLERSAPSLVG